MKDPGPPPICPYRRLAPVSFSLPSIMSLPPFQKSRYALVLVLHRSVQLTVFLIPLCILLASPRIWPVALGQFDPGACIRADRFRCQPCRAIGCPFIHERTPDIDAKVVRQHLAPRVRTRPSAYDANTGHRRAQIPDTFGTFPQSKYYTLVDCTQDVALPMKRAESKENPTSIRVTMGRALPVQVWKEDDAVGAYRAAVHELLDTPEGHPAGEPFAVPVQRVRGRQNYRHVIRTAGEHVLEQVYAPALVRSAVAADRDNCSTAPEAYHRVARGLHAAPVGRRSVVSSPHDDGNARKTRKI